MTPHACRCGARRKRAENTVHAEVILVPSSCLHTQTLWLVCVFRYACLAAQVSLAGSLPWPKLMASSPRHLAEMRAVLKLFEEAAAAGHAGAMANLGCLHLNGRAPSGPKDDAKAVKWFKKAASLVSCEVALCALPTANCCATCVHATLHDVHLASQPRL